MDFFNNTSRNLLGVKPSYSNVVGIPLTAQPIAISPPVVNAGQVNQAQPIQPISVIGSVSQPSASNSVNVGSDAAHNSNATVSPIAAPVSSGTNTQTNTNQPADSGPVAAIKKHKHFLVIGLIAVIALLALTRK